MTCRVAGTGHHCTAETRRELRDGMWVVLHREVDNDHDPDAIAVVTPEGRRLGFAIELSSRLVRHGWRPLDTQQP